MGSVYSEYHLDGSQVAYRVLLEFITQVNDAYNDGGITYNKFIIAEYGSGHPSGLISHEIVGSNPTSATNALLV